MNNAFLETKGITRKQIQWEIIMHLPAAALLSHLLMKRQSPTEGLLKYTCSTHPWGQWDWAK